MAVVSACVYALVFHAAGAAEPSIAIVHDAELGSGGRYGVGQMKQALEARGLSPTLATTLDTPPRSVLIILGEATASGEAARLAETRKISVPDSPEAFTIQRIRTDGKRALLIVGSDDRGLMYGALDVADRIGWAPKPADPLSEVRETTETPAVVERAVSKMVVNRSEFERCFFSEDYWRRYLGMLARDRFNTFVLLFGYNAAGYFDPPYPFLFDVPGFAEVRVVDLPDEAQQRNLEALNALVRMTHEHGMDFRVAIWTHIYRGVDEPTAGVVWGLTDDNLIPYTEAAFAKFLEEVPGIDSFQFRVHTESSVKLPQMIAFWDMMLGVIEASGKDIPVDMRAKGFSDDMIEAALASDVPIRLTTKYWGEQMGLPYHPTHITGFNQFLRRHGYADLLRYPKAYDMHWRLWTCGTNRVLPWGDPEYVKRFVESTYLYDGKGFEVYEPLAFKMAHHRGPTYDLLAPQYRYYDWEFERFWHFYQVFGRAGYNPDTPDEVWRAPFVKRFGKETGPTVEEALHTASRILPRIVGYSLRDLSADFAWAERQRWEDLHLYAINEPSDTAQFASIQEAARAHIENRDLAKRHPLATAAWFSEVSDRVFELVDSAEARVGEHRSTEFDMTMRDLRILANLARYHARRVPAGLAWSYYAFTHDYCSLKEAIAREKEAIATWKTIVNLTDGVFADNMIMGAEGWPFIEWWGEDRLTGDWGDELAKLEKDLEGLEDELASYEPRLRQVVGRYDFGDAGVEEGYNQVHSESGFDRGAGRHGEHAPHFWWSECLLPPPALSEQSVEKESDKDFVHGPHPESYTYSAFGAHLPNGHYELRFRMLATSEDPEDYGPMWIEANGMDSTERFVVPAGELVERTLKTAVTDGTLNVVFNSTSAAKWLVNSMDVVRIDPFIAHVPVRKTAPRNKVSVRATVVGEADIRNVLVWYGNEEQGFKTASMARVDAYEWSAVIPAQDAGSAFFYFIEAADKKGRRATFPAGGAVDAICVIVSGDNDPPEVVHERIASAKAGKPLAVKANVRDAAGVQWVRLRYRGVSQHQDYRTLEMLPAAKNHEYAAEVPGAHIRPQWDLMYYIEVMDKAGNGCIYPDLEEEAPYVVVRLEREPAAEDSA